MVYGQIMSCITGIGRPRIGNKDLRKIKIPVPPKELQDKALISLNATLTTALQLKEKATTLFYRGMYNQSLNVSIDSIKIIEDNPLDKVQNN